MHYILMDLTRKNNRDTHRPIIGFVERPDDEQLIKYYSALFENMAENCLTLGICSVFGLAEEE